MLETGDVSRPVPHDADRFPEPTRLYSHPDDVLQDRALKPSEKRAILADWASDAHAVPNLPAMRQLESGAIVSVDVILTALRRLDEAEPAQRRTGAPRAFWSAPRPLLKTGWRQSRRRNSDDDDDPPPCPAAALPPGVELELRRRRDAAWRLAPVA